MKDRLRKRLIWWGLLAGGPLAFINGLFPAFVGQVGTYVFAAVQFALAAVFVRLAWGTFRDEDATARSAQFTVGIAVLSIAIMAALAWTIAAYITGQQGMLTSPVVGGYIILAVFGEALLLTIPDRSGKVPTAHLWILWAALAIGLGAGLATVVFDLEKGLAPAPL